MQITTNKNTQLLKSKIRIHWITTRQNNARSCVYVETLFELVKRRRKDRTSSPEEAGICVVEFVVLGNGEEEEAKVWNRPESSAKSFMYE